MEKIKFSFICDVLFMPNDCYYGVEGFHVHRGYKSNLVCFKKQKCLKSLQYWMKYTSKPLPRVFRVSISVAYIVAETIKQNSSYTPIT